MATLDPGEKAEESPKQGTVSVKAKTEAPAMNRKQRRAMAVKIRLMREKKARQKK